MGSPDKQPGSPEKEPGSPDKQPGSPKKQPGSPDKQLATPNKQPPPPPPPIYIAKKGRWSTSLCGCFSDMPSCCWTLWCPWVTFGRNVEILDKGTSSCAASGAVFFILFLFTGWECIYSFIYRAKLRYEYSLPPHPCPDCCVHFFCMPCAICQEYRELKNRGLDPALGWYGNLRKNGQEILMPVAPPVVPEEMKR